MSALASMAPTMSSVELVELINSHRDKGRAELRHDHFMVRIEKHPGIDSPKFLGQYKDSTGRTLKCYHLPKRETELMVMSESLAVQAKVYDRMVELEAVVAENLPAARHRQPVSPSQLSEIRVIDYIRGMVAKVPGALPEVAAAISLRLIEQRTGIPATEFGSALPAGDLDKAAKLNPTEIGKRLTPNLSAVKVNKILIDIGMQRKTESGHVLTESGAVHGESRPFQANNAHVGDQIHWYESIVKEIEAGLSRPPASPQTSLI